MANSTTTKPDGQWKTPSKQKNPFKSTEPSTQGSSTKQGLKKGVLIGKAPAEDLGTVVAFGEALDRKTLHQDPFLNLELEDNLREKAREKHEKFASVKVERENLQKIVFEQTLQRFKHTLGDPEAGTLCEDQDILDHCAEPLMELMEQYNIWLEDTRKDVEEKGKLLDFKNGEIQKLSRENEKYNFVAEKAKTKKEEKKLTWQDHEELLFSERQVNRKLVSMMSEKGFRKLSVSPGREHNYAKYLRNNSNFATGLGNGNLFPRRRLSPRY